MSGPSPVVVKFGGELIEQPSSLATVVSTIAAATATEPNLSLVLVHGGGREIDAALKAAAIEKHQVEGLRITDEATLDVVVGVLAGLVNTRLVAALTAAGVRAVGLTGADDGAGLSALAPPHVAVDGRSIDLGRVGIPAADTGTKLLGTLVENGFVPVVASIGVDVDGALLNVNADTFAGHLAGRLQARRLVVAGATAGVPTSTAARCPSSTPNGLRRWSRAVRPRPA